MFRMCHHDHAGWTVQEVADLMGRSEDWVLDRLSEMEVLAPQLFPILTPRQHRVRTMVRLGLTNAQMAQLLKISCSTVSNVLVTLRNKGCLESVPDAVAVVSYESSMDNQIKEKF